MPASTFSFSSMDRLAKHPHDCHDLYDQGMEAYDNDDDDDDDWNHVGSGGWDDNDHKMQSKDVHGVSIDINASSSSLRQHKSQDKYNPFSRVKAPKSPPPHVNEAYTAVDIQTPATKYGKTALLDSTPSATAPPLPTIQHHDHCSLVNPFVAENRAPDVFSVGVFNPIIPVVVASLFSIRRHTLDRSYVVFSFSCT
jgi:hypothetical protein